MTSTRTYRLFICKFGCIAWKKVWIIFLCLTTAHGVSYRHYEKVLEMCLNSAISTHTSTHMFHCGQLCEVYRPECSGFCYSEADSSCILHKIVHMGSGTEEIGFRTYKHFGDEMNHADSFNHCISVGGFLALPKNLEQNNYLQQVSGGNYIYLPADDAGHEGSFLTSGDPSLYGGDQVLNYAKWTSDEPNGGTDENCVELESTGWNDIPCTTLKQRVCQAPRPEICTTLPHPVYPDLRCYKRKL